MGRRTQRSRKMLGAALLASALVWLSGCFPGQFPAPEPHGPPTPSTKASSQAMPHAFGGPVSTPKSAADGGAD